MPEREWHVPGLIPQQQVTLLSGDGGLGKSLLALQLGVATVTPQGSWIGHMVATGPAVVVAAEDHVPELHRRLVDVVAAMGTRLEDLQDLHIVPLAGEDATLMRAGPQSRELIRTQRLNQLEDMLKEVRPRLLVLDTSADLYGGDEIDRSQVRRFVAELRGLAITYHAAVLLLSHPSQSGMASGSGTSGSTAWSNSVRSRLYLEKGDNTGPDERVLKVMKSNYGRTGNETVIRYDADVDAFRLAFPVGSPAVSAVRMKFLELLDKFEARKHPVSNKDGRNYAPTLFEREPEVKGQFKKNALHSAMNELLDNGVIKAIEEGPASRRRTRLIRCS